MQVILTKSIRKLGKVGDVVQVKDGYSRNYLFPQQLAVRATTKNINDFANIKKDLEKKDQENIATAQKIAKLLENQHVIFSSPSSADGKLFGSITPRVIASELSDMTNANIIYSNVVMNDTIKFNGVYPVQISLHPEVNLEVLVVVAKTKEEAQIMLQDHLSGANQEEGNENEEAN